MQNDELNRASGAGVATFIALAAGLAFTSTAYAEYPDKPVTLVVPYSAGGSTETLARVFSKALSDELGQPVIVKTPAGFAMCVLTACDQLDLSKVADVLEAHTVRLATENEMRRLFPDCEIKQALEEAVEFAVSRTH